MSSPTRAYAGGSHADRSYWSEADVASYLESGLTPEGDVAGGLMAEVIDNGLTYGPTYLTAADLRAIAAYILSGPPIEHAVD